ncbi:MAG: hypothetical protein KUG77_06750 [Nannocystaceae bacterium]|nr:hypothetical protein [Nannocystaceae bacterium]
MKRFSALLALPLLLSACVTEADIVGEAFGDVVLRTTSAVPSLPGLYGLEFEQAAGTQRAYILYLPPGYDETRPEPYETIFMFHGGGQSALQFAGSPGMLKLHEHAEDDDRIVVFLQGRVGSSLTATGWWITNPALRDDLGYTEELLDHLETELNVDTDRVFAGGYSNGGRFVHELASELSDRFLAYAAVSGYYGNALTGSPSGPPAGTMVPFFIANTLTDSTVPYGGSAGFPFYTPAQDAYDGWYSDDGCTLSTNTYNITVASYDATACVSGTYRNILQFVSVDDVTTSSHHAWPTFGNSGYEATNGMVGFWDAQ